MLRLLFSVMEFGTELKVLNLTVLTHCTELIFWELRVCLVATLSKDMSLCPDVPSVLVDTKLLGMSFTFWTHASWWKGCTRVELACFVLPDCHLNRRKLSRESLATCLLSSLDFWNCVQLKRFKNQRVLLVFLRNWCAGEELGLVT